MEGCSFPLHATSRQYTRLWLFSLLRSLLLPPCDPPDRAAERRTTDIPDCAAERRTTDCPFVPPRATHRGLFPLPPPYRPNRRPRISPPPATWIPGPRAVPVDPCHCEVGKRCCARWILEAEQDFAAEKSLLETVILEAGHEVIFYPKFHCELNYIEYYWGALKKYTREHRQHPPAEPEGTVLEAMDSVSLRTIWRFAERSKRWTMAYINGLTEEQIGRAHV